MIQKAYDLVTAPLARELLRLGTDWMRFEWHSETEFSTHVLKSTYLKSIIKGANEVAGMAALSLWLCNGPKTFRPTAEQCAALDQIEARLPIADYAQPYPALLIDLPPGRYAPFTSAVVGTYQCADRPTQILVGALFSEDHTNDITTVASNNHPTLEDSIRLYQADCADLSTTARNVMRVAINSCLALVNYGCHAQYLSPAEVLRDRKWAKADQGRVSERASRAKERLATAISVVSFSQEVKLHREERARETGELTSREMSPHWRRGHWHTVLHGVGKTQRKLVLFPPVLVRGDLFVGELSDTAAEYRA